MKIFRDYTFTWWQMSCLKVSAMAIGVALGANFANAFLPYTTVLVALAVALGLYLVYIAFKK